MGEVLVSVVMLAAFAGIYALLHRRAARRSGSPPPIQWGWIAAIVACAVVAVVAGLLL